MKTLNLHQFMPYQWSVLEQRISEAIAQHYKIEFNLTRMEWRVMATLAMFDLISAKDICQFTQLEKMQVSRAIARLKQAALVSQSISSMDNRSSELSLTARGLNIYHKIIPEVKREEQQILSVLTETEQKQLFKIMTKLEKELLEQ